MSNHADELARLRDAVVEAAKAWAVKQDDPDQLIALETDDLYFAAAALMDNEALTCETCGGSGIRIRDMQNPKCPACHGTGRKPDTFRDDGATTPEGCEDERQGEVPGA